MSAEVLLLREAAEKMRERAEAATPGPWRDMPMGSEGSVVLNDGKTIHTARKPATCREFSDAEHIASWHPAAALAVADWLDLVASKGAINIRPGRYLLGWDNAIAVARAYLGADQ